MATYYIDADNGNNAADGLTPTGDAINGPWLTLDQFTESARSAGDIAILRGGMTNGYDDGSDLNFTSDGNIDSPIIITADYGDAWGDHVNTSGTATATVTFGSKTITCTADVSGVIAAGDIIYISGDDNTEFSYEVATVATTTVTLHLPYKGNNAGASKTIINMQNPPHWNDATTDDFQWNFDLDHHWKVQGILIRGTDSNGQIEVDSVYAIEIRDCILVGNESTSYGVRPTDDTPKLYLKKCRSVNTYGLFGLSTSIQGGLYVIEDCFFSGGTGGLVSLNGAVYIIDCEFSGHSTDDVDVGAENVLFRNTKHDSSSGTYGDQMGFLSLTTGGINNYSIEDYNQVIGDSRYLTNRDTSNAHYQSETTKVRSGGSNRSIKIQPNTYWSTNWYWSHIKIFEIPIYATTDSKTYTVYFASDTTTEWTTGPTASELWIELEAWGHASNNYRKITKSTGTVDFTTDTDFDQSLSVTVAPAQAGIAYLRCWYAKPKESTKSNIFYVDPIPAIS